MSIATSDMSNISPLKKHKSRIEGSSMLTMKSHAEKEKEIENTLWKHIRAGLRLRNIVSSKRMNETSIVATNVEAKKLIITRQLGFRDLIPGCGQW